VPILNIVEEVETFADVENQNMPFSLQVTETRAVLGSEKVELRAGGNGCIPCATSYETLYVYPPTIWGTGQIYEINNDFPYADIQVSNFSCKLLSWDGKGKARIKFNGVGTFEILIGAYRQNGMYSYVGEDGVYYTKECYCLETLYRYIFEVKIPSRD
ncbi:hypothetical protein LJC57_08050, partial [Parabacteroides sp. OttesenSCG-928-G07]|nr:hypothetical protein [Parabacteroides sp. OttesenSCG-928-G07]